MTECGSDHLQMWSEQLDLKCILNRLFVIKAVLTQCEHLFWHAASVSVQYETLLVFDTSQNKTRVTNTKPALPWKGGILPSDKPQILVGKPIHTNTLLRQSWPARIHFVHFCVSDFKLTAHLRSIFPSVWRYYWKSLCDFMVWKWGPSVYLCLYVCASRLKYAGYYYDCSECQRGRGYSHRSHFLQVNI